MESDVLVVDDSAAIRKILQRVLRQTGMAIRTIHEAGDGQEALEQLKSPKPGLVLTDINMPNMDGLQLLAAMKASGEWRHIPVMMITTEGAKPKSGKPSGWVRPAMFANPSPRIRSRRNWSVSWSRRCRYEPARNAG